MGLEAVGGGLAMAGDLDRDREAVGVDPDTIVLQTCLSI